MRVRCSKCHHAFEIETAEFEGLACPNCGAEAGFEPEHGVPIPMKLFGLLLAGVVVATVAGGLLSRLSSG